MSAVKICLLILFSLSYVTSECGKSTVTIAIRVVGVGGRFSVRNEYPWVVSLGTIEDNYFVHRCGGTILNERWIITSAVCASVHRVSEMKALIGSTFIGNISNFSFVTGIKRIVIHEKFQLPSFANDIALLFTETPIPINKRNINSICLPKQNQIISKTVFTIGWGSNEDFGDPSEELKVIDVRIYNDSYCESLHNKEVHQFYKELMFCGRGRSRYSDVCRGNIGGTAQQIVASTAFLVGIVSFGFGKGCFQRSTPTIYTKVPHYVDWIQKVINEVNETQVKKEIKTDKLREEVISECGIRYNQNEGKVVGGRFATKNEFPWTVALEEFKYGDFVHFCGASVISDRWIVTAAHCLYRKYLKRLRGVFGATNLDEVNDDIFITSFIDFRVHESYDHQSRSFENDIALLKTKDRIPSLTQSKNINRICLPKSKEQFSGRVYVTGWGRTHEEDETSNHLKVLAINLYDDSDCETLYENRFKPEKMLCAGYLNGTRDSCEGDSGGPLEKVINGKRYLVGIVSFGEGCARKFYPGVYTEVSQYVNWIQNIIGNESNTVSLRRSGENVALSEMNRNEHQFRVFNKCPFTVWMATLGNWDKTNPENGGFELKSNSMKSFFVEKRWSGRLWGRTGCNEDSCVSGDCGKGQSGCHLSRGQPPVTLIQMSLDVRNGEDFYRLNLVNGFNIPLSMKLNSNIMIDTSNDTKNCGPAFCNKDLNANCPPQLSMFHNGTVVGCKSICYSKEFCCRNESNKKIMRCKSNQMTNYDIVFCENN